MSNPRVHRVWKWLQWKFNTKIAYKVLYREKNKHIICRHRSVCIGKNCAFGLEDRPQPAALGCTQDLWHSFSQYGPPGRQITYIYFRPTVVCVLANSVTFSVLFYKLWQLPSKEGHLPIFFAFMAGCHWCKDFSSSVNYFGIQWSSWDKESAMPKVPLSINKVLVVFGKT